MSKVRLSRYVVRDLGSALANAAPQRAHRTGQTRPVTVKVLAIRDTVEEKLVERRAELRGKGKATTARPKAAGLEDDLDMRRYIEVSSETIYFPYTQTTSEPRVLNGEWERF